jgi:peptidoglycan hydrolase CwlO-like protein
MIKLLWALCGVSLISMALLLELSGVTEANNTDLLRDISTLDAQISTLESTVAGLQQKVHSIDQNYAKTNQDRKQDYADRLEAPSR